MNIAESFYQHTKHTKKRNLYNITSLDNIPSIIQNGILSFNSAEKFQHTSVALTSVQERRSSVCVPGGLSLHDYANLYFDFHNPMLFKLKDIADTLCVLAVSAAVLDIEDCVVSDRNAAAGFARFYSAKDGIGALDFNRIYAEYWTDANPFVQSELKAIKCAEVLVPRQIPYDYVVGAYVVSDEASQILKAAGFAHKIVVNPGVFFRKGG